MSIEHDEALHALEAVGSAEALWGAVRAATPFSLVRQGERTYQVVGEGGRTPRGPLLAGDVVLERLPGLAARALGVVEAEDGPYVSLIGPEGVPGPGLRLRRLDGRLAPEQAVVRLVSLPGAGAWARDAEDPPPVVVPTPRRSAAQWLAAAGAGFLGKIPERQNTREGSRVLFTVLKPEQLGFKTWKDPGAFKARDDVIVGELLKGNVPRLLREGRLVRVEFTGKDKKPHGIVYQVLPDYILLGNTRDHVLAPLTPPGAQKVADAYGCILPTALMVDQIFDAAGLRLDAQDRGYYMQGQLNPATGKRLPVYDPTRDKSLATHEFDEHLKRPDCQVSTAAFLEHDLAVRQQMKRAGVERRSGMPLVAGHKKVLVIAARPNPKRMQFYGFYRLGGKRGVPIQAQSGPGLPDNAHDPLYVDYSHGVRLVAATMLVDGNEMAAAEVLAHDVYSWGLSREGPIKSPRVPGTAP